MPSYFLDEKRRSSFYFEALLSSELLHEGYSFIDKVSSNDTPERP